MSRIHSSFWQFALVLKVLCAVAALAAIALLAPAVATQMIATLMSSIIAHYFMDIARFSMSEGRAADGSAPGECTPECDVPDIRPD